MNMFQSNTFKANRFQKRVDRFKNPIFIEESYDTFDFNGNLKSTNIPKLNFTNFTSSNLCKKYLDLKEICLCINANNSKWEKLFLADEVNMSIDIPKINRIYQIISIVNNREIERDELILKFRNIQDKEIQFFIKKENRNT